MLHSIKPFGVVVGSEISLFFFLKSNLSAQGLHYMKEVVMSGITGAGIPRLAPLLQDPHCDTTTLTIVTALCFGCITQLW